MEDKKLYSSGEFAKLFSINKRTLHYYNDIGLFTPSFIDHNGFHFYSYKQFSKLELILILRKTGLSINEIKEYLKEPSNETFINMINNRVKYIDDKIKELTNTKNFLALKTYKLSQFTNSTNKHIEIVNLKERKIFKSEPINNDEYNPAIKFSLRLKELFNLYDSYGSAIKIDTIFDNNFDDYDYFYAYCPSDYDSYDEILPSGTYLRAYYIGEWDNIATIYHEIIEYAKDNKLLLTGYAYEEGLNEMVISEEKDYLTMITIKCEKMND